MKTLPLFAGALTLLGTALPVSTPAGASTGIQRCAGPDGATIYTDRACSRLGARAVPMSGALRTRILEQQSVEAELQGDTLADAGPVDALPAIGRRSPADGCARSPTQLAMDLQGSFALRDVNRLAESWHWAGMKTAQARPAMARLERLARESLRDLQFIDARIGVGGLQLADASNGIDGSAGLMQLTVGGASPDMLDLQVHRYHGCYFVRF